MSLKKKIILLVLAISFVTPMLAGYIIYRNSLSTQDYQTISDQSLPRTRDMGEALFNFRQVRVQVRSLAIRGNTPEDTKNYLARIEESLANFEKSRSQLMNKMNSTAEEKVMIEKFDSAWKTFAAFGGEVLALAAKGDEASLNQLAEMVRVRCPILAVPVEKAIEEMFAWQTKLDVERVAQAKEKSDTTLWVSIALVSLSVILSTFFGIYFANTLVKSITENVSNISSSVLAIHHKSEDVASVASNLSEAATEQAAGLQETVTSIDQISAMIQRNSDSAVTSSQISEKSKIAAQRGKEKVEEMLNSIKDIAEGNNDLIGQVQKSNKEISEIVNVINDIAAKTVVINDIVFQTKLLSFNASVEAARAGEHGKGFAVVAEEVGNLASMSGNAATEISTMLNHSVNKVTEIVSNTKTMMDRLIINSKEKIDTGSQTAKECALSLDEILTNVTHVNEMVKEISVASQEQSAGVREVNKAMGQLDQITQQNSASAEASDKAANELNSQVQLLNTIVKQLSTIVTGEQNTVVAETPKVAAISEKVIPIRKKEVKPETKTVSSTPVSSDPRFEEA